MKHSIRKNDVKYIVNPEQKKVVAYIEGTKDMFIRFVSENEGPWVSHFSWCNGDIHDNFLTKLEMPNRFVGIATCGPDDVWNEETGKLIAFDRMKDKVNRAFFKRANTYVEIMENRLDSFCETINIYGERLTQNTARRKEVINRVLGDEQ